MGEAECGGGRPTIKHHQRGRRSIHDIRLNEYMNSNESGPHVVLTSGPQGLSPGSAEVRVEVWAVLSHSGTVGELSRPHFHIEMMNVSL